MSDVPSMWEALAALQAEIPRIVKGDAAQVGTRETRYANLERITDAVRPLIAKHGFAWVCEPTVPGPEVVDAKFVLHYRLIYAPTGGVASEGNYPLPSGTPQTMGGAGTYARRYALCAALNITPAEDDDDAEQATREAEERQNARTRYVAEERASDPGPRTPAERGPVNDDPWATPAAPEDEPGAVGRDNRLRARLHAAFGRAKITGRDDRLAYAKRKLQLAELGSSNDLSLRQAHELIAALTADANEQEGN